MPSSNFCFRGRVAWPSPTPSPTRPVYRQTLLICFIPNPLSLLATASFIRSPLLHGLSTPAIVPCRSPSDHPPLHMASPVPDVPPETSFEQEYIQTEQPGLKYLGVVEVAVDKATKYMANVYEFAKESSGPLKPGVTNAETSVSSVVGPVYQEIEGKPYEILLFVDKQVDGAVGVIGGGMPQSVKDATAQAYGVARQVPDTLKSVVSDLQANGLVETAKSYYSTYEPVAEEWASAAWKQFLKLPYAPQAVHFVAPPTMFCADKFNQVVEGLKGKQVPLANYIPVVPIEKLEKAVNVDSM